MTAEIFVPDDGPTGHGARFSSLDGSTAVQVDGLPHGERGDHVPGFICIQHGNASNITLVDSFDIYTSDLAFIAAVSSIITSNTPVAGACVRAVRPTGPFYVLANASRDVFTIDTAGNVGAQSWTLTDLGTAGLTMGISQDEATIYYADRQNNARPLKRWDTASNTGLSDLFTLGASERFGNDILTFADGSFILIVRTSQPGPDPLEIRKYDADGNLLDTLDITGSNLWEEPEMCVDIDDDGYFWVRRFTDDTGATSTFTRYAVADLSVSREFVIDTDPTDNGIGITPSSCPIVMLANAISHALPRGNIGPIAWLDMTRVQP